MRFRIEHETVLEFAEPVHEHHCELRVAPRVSGVQHVPQFSIETDPPAEIFSYTDAFQNRVHHFSVLRPHVRLVTRVKSEVDCLLENPFDFRLMTPANENTWYHQRFAREPSLWQYVLHESAATPAFHTLSWDGQMPPVRNADEPVQNSILNAMTWVSETLSYRSGSTQAHSPLADALRARAGVCQDFAHLLISVIRSWGIPARYLMGYIDPGVGSTDEPEEPQASHAWVEALIPGAGWRGFDATRQLVANNSYISVAVGRTLDPAPQRGTFKGPAAGQLPTVKLQIERQNQQ